MSEKNDDKRLAFVAQCVNVGMDPLDANEWYCQQVDRHKTPNNELLAHLFNDEQGQRAENAKTRKAAERERKRQAGLVRFEVWIRPEWAGDIRALIEKLEKDDDRPTDPV